MWVSVLHLNIETPLEAPPQRSHQQSSRQGAELIGSWAAQWSSISAQGTDSSNPPGAQGVCHPQQHAFLAPLSTMEWMGSMTYRSSTFPTLIPVNPALAHLPIAVRSEFERDTENISASCSLRCTHKQKDRKPCHTALFPFRKSCSKLFPPLRVF